MPPKIRHDELDHAKNENAKKDWLPDDADPAADQDHELPREDDKDAGIAPTPLPPD